MSTQTLAEAAKLISDEIVQGVAEDIITTNPMLAVLPFIGYAGQGMIVNRENALGNAGVYAVGATITDKAAATYTTAIFKATKLIGDAEMDGLVQAQSMGAGVDQLALEIGSKAKSIGRLFQTGMATGTGTSPEMNSFHTLVDAAQYTTASAGQVLSLALLDELLDLVKAKDGEVDFISMNGRTLRSYKTLIRALGGVNEVMAFTMPNGTTRNVSVYEGIPIFQNDYLSVAETANGAALTTGALTSVYAGVFDDGTEKVGVAGIHPVAVPAGIVVENIGNSDSKDEQIVRIKQYANFASFNRRGIARLTSISN
jgi:hypothetical protein